MASMVVGRQTSETDGISGGGLLLSACRRHLSPSRGGAGTSVTFRSAGKRRRLEQQQLPTPGGQSQAAGDADGSAAAESTGGLAVGSGNAHGGGTSGGKEPRNGPFRVLLTTGKTPSSSTVTAVSSAASSKGIQNRKAATAAGSARLLSSVAMDLAHSLAMQSSSSSSSSLLPCRGCGANSGTSNTRNQQCQCVDVVYILPASVGGVEEGHTGDDEEEEEVGADLFPLRCRRVDNSSMNDHTSSNDNNDADDADGTDPATNPRSSSSSSSSQSSSSPSWDEGALSRIQIRRMRDGTDLVRYLATVPLLPPHQQPRQGIVLNDIGSFVLGNAINGNGGGSSTQSVASSLGPSYYTIDSSTVLTQIRKSKHEFGLQIGLYDTPSQY